MTKVEVVSDPAIVTTDPAIAWVATARYRDAATRQRLTWLQVAHDDDRDYRRLTCTDPYRLHQARLPIYRLPEALRDPGLFDVHRATMRETTLQRRMDDPADLDWVNWRRLIPDWDAAGEQIGFLSFHAPRHRCGAAIGWLLRNYGAATGAALDADLIRDLWCRGVTFEARSRGAGAELMLQHELGRERLTALVMPLQAAEHEYRRPNEEVSNE